MGDGELGDELRASAEARALGSRLIWAGFRRDMPDIYFASDVVAQTSDNEGTPVALIEAQAAGVPVVTTAVGGVASAVLDGETGRITAVGEDAAMAERSPATSTMRLRRREHGERGRAHVRASFTLDALVAEIDGLYQGLLSSDGVGRGTRARNDCVNAARYRTEARPPSEKARPRSRKR